MFGAYHMLEKEKLGKFAFIFLFLLFCLLPFAGMPLWGMQGAESDDTILSLPSFLSDGKLNLDFFSELGDYFSDNFAFRRQMVTANTALKETLFQTSALPEKVVIGKDGWYFMTDTVDDCFGRKTLSDLQISEISYNIGLLQDTLTEEGIDFVFTIAPNKNSLYPQYMPQRYQKFAKGHETSNAARLTPYLKKAGIRYVDLFKLFGGESKVYYHKTDSHWNNAGAALAQDALLTALKKKHTDYTNKPYTERYDFEGDLFAMLYPSGTDHERELYYKLPDYTYKQEIESTFDPKIETSCSSAEGSVVMFRDSFGNALLPFIASEYSEGYFVRASENPVYEAVRRKADAVILECVERHLMLLQTYAPVVAMHPEKLKESVPGKETDRGFLETYDEYNSGLLKIVGTMDERRVGANTKSYICFRHKKNGTRAYFPAYHTNDIGSEKPECGLCTYINREELPAGTYSLSIVSECDGTVTSSGELLEKRL